MAEWFFIKTVFVRFLLLNIIPINIASETQRNELVLKASLH